jgi:hypothetical protein
MKDIMDTFLSKSPDDLRTDFSKWQNQVAIISKVHFENDPKGYLKRPGYSSATIDTALHTDFFDTAIFIAKDYLDAHCQPILEKLLEESQLRALLRMPRKL